MPHPLIELITKLFVDIRNNNLKENQVNETLQTIKGFNDPNRPVTSDELVKTKFYFDKVNNNYGYLLSMMCHFKSAHGILDALLKKYKHLVTDGKVAQAIIDSDSNEISSYYNALEKTALGRQILKTVGVEKDPPVASNYQNNASDQTQQNNFLNNNNFGLGKDNANNDAFEDDFILSKKKKGVSTARLSHLPQNISLNNTSTNRASLNPNVVHANNEPLHSSTSTTTSTTTSTINTTSEDLTNKPKKLIQIDNIIPLHKKQRGRPRKRKKKKQTPVSKSKKKVPKVKTKNLNQMPTNNNIEKTNMQPNNNSQNFYPMPISMSHVNNRTNPSQSSPQNQQINSSNINITQNIFESPLIIKKLPSSQAEKFKFPFQAPATPPPPPPPPPSQFNQNRTSDNSNNNSRNNSFNNSRNNSFNNSRNNSFNKSCNNLYKNSRNNSQIPSFPNNTILFNIFSPSNINNTPSSMDQNRISTPIMNPTQNSDNSGTSLSDFSVPQITIDLDSMSFKYGFKLTSLQKTTRSQQRKKMKKKQMQNKNTEKKYAIHFFSGKNYHFSPSNIIEILKDILAQDLKLNNFIKNKIEEIKINQKKFDIPETHNLFYYLGFFTKIKTLQMSQNTLKLTPTFLNNFKNLEILRIINNDLEYPPNIDFLQNLELISLHSNKLKSAPNLTFNDRLTKIELYNNKLQTPPNLSKLMQLKRLNLSHNELTSSPNLSQNELLTHLDLENNKIIKFTYLEYLPYLVKLNLSNNYINHILDFKKNKHIEKILLNNNYLTLPPINYNHAKLVKLNLANNKLIKSPEYFPADTDLHNNYITYINTNIIKDAANKKTFRITVNIINNPIFYLPNLISFNDKICFINLSIICDNNICICNETNYLASNLHPGSSINLHRYNLSCKFKKSHFEQYSSLELHIISKLIETIKPFNANDNLQSVNLKYLSNHRGALKNNSITFFTQNNFIKTPFIENEIHKNKLFTQFIHDMQLFLTQFLRHNHLQIIKFITLLRIESANIKGNFFIPQELREYIIQNHIESACRYHLKQKQEQYKTMINNANFTTQNAEDIMNFFKTTSFHKLTIGKILGEYLKKIKEIESQMFYGSYVYWHYRNLMFKKSTTIKATANLLNKNNLNKGLILKNMQKLINHFFTKNVIAPFNHEKSVRKDVKAYYEKVDYKINAVQKYHLRMLILYDIKVRISGKNKLQTQPQQKIEKTVATPSSNEETGSKKKRKVVKEVIIIDD